MKKWIALLLILVMSFPIVACGQSEQTGDTNKGATKAQPEEIVIGDLPVIAVGDSATTAECEFTVEHVEFTKEVVPAQPGELPVCYEAEAGKVYVDFCTAYKNTVNAEADKPIFGSLIYNGRYEYTGYAVIEEESRSAFAYSTRIAPLATAYVHYLFAVPEEVETSGAEIVLKMSIGGAEYKMVLREGDGQAANTTETELGKTSGEVALGEVVVTKDSEFAIVHADITKDVIPPQADGSYMHFEAEDGNVYVDVCFAFKNTSGSEASTDSVISAELKYAGKDSYTNITVIEEEGRSNLTYANVKNVIPLCTEYVHCLFEVPEEVETSEESIELTFTVDGNTYTYIVR